MGLSCDNLEDIYNKLEFNDASQIDHCVEDLTCLEAFHKSLVYSPRPIKQGHA